jgi:hypothetical protein
LSAHLSLVQVGFVHILMLNTYDTHGGLSGDNAQRRFAEADLAGVDRARTPFVLVFTHGPMYNNNAGHQDEPETMIMKAWLEPLVNQYKARAPPPPARRPRGPTTCIPRAPNMQT